MGDSETPSAPGGKPVASRVILSDPGTVELVSSITHDTLSALGAQPVLLLIVILNMIFIGSGAYFFVQLEHFRHDERLQIITLLARCEIPGSPAQRREAVP
jgi:hypothetical protein